MSAGPARKEIVIVGAGTGGVVLANELRGVLGAEHRITLIERSEIHAFPASFLWLMVGQRTRKSITTPVRRLLKPGIRLLIGEAQEISPEDRLVRVGTETIPFLGRENGNLRFRDRDPVQADLVVSVPRHFAPSIVRTANIANDAGWAVTDARTLATRDNSIFAIGDCAAITLPGRWAPDVPLMLPKAGVFAHAQALALAERIAALIEGRRPSREFCGDGFCMLEAGEQLAGFAYGDFYATPAPELHLKRIGPLWHASKVMFERWWLAPPGFRKTALGAAIRAGGRLTGIPVEL